MTDERTFVHWLEDLILLGEDFVIGVDISTRDGDARHDDWPVENREARFAARQIAYCLQVLEAVSEA